MPSIDTDIDAIEVRTSLESCLKIPFSYLDIKKQTLVIKVAAHYVTSLEELVTIGTIASYFDLLDIKMIRGNVILYVQVSDIQDLANGLVTPEDFVDRLGIDGIRV